MPNTSSCKGWCGLGKHPSSSPRARPSSSGLRTACPISRSPRRWAPRAIWYRSGASALPSIFRPRLHSGRPSVPWSACWPSRISLGRVARWFFPPLARHTVVAVACQGVEERDFGGFSHYSVRDLARLVEGRGEILTMSSATVQRILAALVLKPHRLRYFLTRTDPEFEVKMVEIVKLYLDPPRNSRGRCLDEKTGLQALERLHPSLPLRPGLVERQEFEYIRQGGGIGLGYRSEEFDGFQIPRTQRLGRTLETIEILKRAWTGERFSF